MIGLLEHNIVDWAWLAGIIDGEGSIGLIREYDRRRNGRLGYRPSIQVSNTSTTLLEKVIEIVRDGRILTQKERRSCRPQYHWQVRNTARVGWLLINVFPHLTVKRPHAMLMLEWVFLRSALRGRGRYAPRLPREHEIHLELRKLNARGVMR